MSNRLADRADEAAISVEEMADDNTDSEIEGHLIDAHNSLSEVARLDREKNGPTPNDKLAAAVENADGCLHCGDDCEAGWCDMNCLQSWVDMNIE